VVLESVVSAFWLLKPALFFPHLQHRLKESVLQCLSAFCIRKRMPFDFRHVHSWVSAFGQCLLQSVGQSQVLVYLSGFRLPCILAERSVFLKLKVWLGGCCQTVILTNCVCPCLHSLVNGSIGPHSGLVNDFRYRSRAEEDELTVVWKIVVVWKRFQERST
jgi:hypothetical protein